MFHDRSQAGARLAQALDRFRNDDVVVLGLPRGGVPVAAEIARSLGAPLDLILVRKLGVPFQPELAMGAIGEDGVRVLNDEVCRAARVTDDELARVEATERTELDRRAALFRSEAPRVDLRGRVALIVDDGIATGSTAKAACRVARAHGARRVVLAAPVAPPDVRARFKGLADEVITLATPEGFRAVGQYYVDFTQVPDEEVLQILARSARPALHAVPDPDPDPASAPDPDPDPVSDPSDDPSPRSQDVEVASGRLILPGHLDVPARPLGIVIFAHGSGSSRHSPRNRFVASVLNEAGLATLLFDLLTPAEEVDRANVFDVELLAGRLTDATAWVRRHPAVDGLPVGYFGASTGAAAALWAAAAQGDRISAVVSRGGRPDLADRRLAAVTAPTLLVVGGHDDVVIGLNELAAARLRCEHRLVIVPGATHLFEEPGTLRAAADEAANWFRHHLGAGERLPAQH